MTTPSSPAHAGVHFPPPLLYVVALALGWRLNRWRPMPLTASASMGRLIGATICVATFLVLVGGALAAFRRARTTLIPTARRRRW